MSKKFMIVAITGRSGSGKSSVAKYYSSLGYPVADGDKISREVTEPGSQCLKDLVAAFGEDILENGWLNRRKLGGIVFADSKANKKLVEITHPYILKSMLEKAEKAKNEGHSLFFVDGAVIVGAPFEEHCDRIIVVISDRRLSVSRIILRDGISKSAAHKRLEAQMPEQALIDAADFVIQNNTTEASLAKQADIILEKLLMEVGSTENQKPQKENN